MKSPEAVAVGSHTARTAGDLLRRLRAALAHSFPAIPVGTLMRIAKGSGEKSFPPGFLVSGQLDDRSASGARAALKRLARGDDSVPVHPLFSAEFYHLANPDLASATGIGWQHYQVFGRVEERSPHPLIDVKFLGAAMPSLPSSELLDQYLADPAYWFAEPGPYVDCQRFMLLGEWDHRTNPLEQIVSRHLTSHWVHSRLMLVDAASHSQAVARLAAIGFLLSQNGGRNRLAQLTRWDHRSAQPGSAKRTVVPGFLLASGEAILETLGADAVSPDLTVVRLAGEYIGVRSGSTIRGERLYWIGGYLGRSELAELVAASDGSVVVAPSSTAQETSLRQLRRDLAKPSVTVLPFGKQVTVDTNDVTIVAASPMPQPPVWSWSSSEDNTSLAIVLADSHRLRATGDPDLRAALAAGASLCLVTDGRLNSWLPQLQSRQTVVVDPGLVSAVGAFIDTASMHMLPSSGDTA